MKISKDFLATIEKVSKIIIVPNACKIVKKAEVNGVVIGKLKRALCIFDSDGELLRCVASSTNDPKELPIVDNELIKLLSSVLPMTNMEVEEHYLLFAHKRIADQKAILIKYESLFGNLGIFPIPHAKKQPDCLYYKLIEAPASTIEAHNEDDKYKRLAVEGLDGIYIPLVKDIEAFYDNRYRISVFLGIRAMYDLPVLINAGFSASHVNEAITLSSYDEQLSRALYGWKSIVPKAGGVIADEWDDLSALLALTDYASLPFT